MPWFSLVRKSRKHRFRPRKWSLWTTMTVVTMLLVGLLQSPSFATETAKHYDELEFPPLPELQFPDYEHFTLDNGMDVYLMEDRELPLVSGRALIHTGDRFEPANKVGLASLTGEVMRTGGTKTHTPDELNQLLEQRAASVETSIGTTAGSAHFSALSEDLEQVFDIFVEVLREPTFAPDKLEVAKTQRRGNISRRNDDPNDIASREFRKLIYGSSNPYARTTEYTTINNITRDDLVDFYQKYYHPNNTILGIVGDFDAAEMRSLLQAKLGDWSANPNLDLPAKPNVSQAHQSGIYMVDRPQLTQSYVQLGHLGGQLSNPDYAALDVMNGVLNGFGGRLFNEVRSDRGLAYSVYAAWSARYDYPGMFIAGGQTRSEATVPFINVVRQEIERLRQEPITTDELNYAKDSTLNSFIFNFEDPSQTLSRLMRYDYYDYPEDFIFQYRREVENTTIEDVQRVAQEYLNPDQLVTLVVGSLEAIEPPLTALPNSDKVTSIDVSIPEPPSS